MELESLDGLRLEGVLDEPVGPRAAIVLCHPHPKMGGTMNAPLLQALSADLVRRAWSVLRFNFRGIGASEGQAGTGTGETEDVAGALDFMREHHAGAPVALAGWSFGAAVALRVAAHDEAVAACVGIAPAVRRKPDVTEGLPSPDEVSFAMPLLIVCSANDDVVAPEEGREWAKAVGAEYVELRGANHFFWGRYDPLNRAVGGWLDRAL